MYVCTYMYWDVEWRLYRLLTMVDVWTKNLHVIPSSMVVSALYVRKVSDSDMSACVTSGALPDSGACVCMVSEICNSYNFNWNDGLTKHIFFRIVE